VSAGVGLPPPPECDCIWVVPLELFAMAAALLRCDGGCPAAVWSHRLDARLT
jgi:hypothetical protein